MKRSLWKKLENKKSCKMSKHTDDGTGNSERDWEIFDVLCQSNEKVCEKWFGNHFITVINDVTCFNPISILNSWKSSHKNEKTFTPFPYQQQQFVYIDFNSTKNKEHFFRIANVLKITSYKTSNHFSPPFLCSIWKTISPLRKFLHSMFSFRNDKVKIRMIW